MRIVGNQNRTELELDPTLMMARALAWRATDNFGSVPHLRGVFRGTQAHFNAMDAARAIRQARVLNAPRTA
jgi:hypothetical protein